MNITDIEPTNTIVIYQTNDGETCIDVKFQDETVWLSQSQMAELFQKDRTVIGRHINNIFKEEELEESLVCAKFAHTKNILSDRHYALISLTAARQFLKWKQS